MKRRMQTQYDLLSPYSKRIRESKAAISRKGAKKKILDQCRQLGMSEILDSVWIGDSSSADKVLESEGNTLGLGFTHLLDLRINTNSRSAREKKGLFLKPMDEEGESILMNEGSALNHHCLDFVDEIKKSAEGKALICCNTGNNASIAVLVAYMITRLRFKVLSSLRYIHAKRPTIWPEPYISQLVSLEDVMLLDCNEEPMTMKPHSSMNEPPPILGSRTDFLNQPPPILSPLPPILSSKLTTLDSISESSNGNMVPCKGTLSQSSMEKQSFDRLKQMVERIRHSLLHVDKIEGIGFGTLADFDEIAKNVYLGDKWAGRQSVLGEEGPCSKLGITHVIDASDNSLYSSDTKLHKVKWLKLNLDDDGFTDITENDFKLLKTAFSFIDEALTKSGKILIHCSAGVNRSTTIYTAWLMKTRLWTLRKSLCYIKLARPCVWPQPYLGQLLQFEDKLKSEGIALKEITLDVELHPDVSGILNALEEEEELYRGGGIRSDVSVGQSFIHDEEELDIGNYSSVNMELS